MYKDLLLQLLIITFPILLYYSILKSIIRSERILNIVAVVTLVLTGLLCMTFRIDVAGFNMDLRYVPWFISFVYGGPTAGIIVTISMVIYRMILGGTGVIIFIFVVLAAIPFLIKLKDFSLFSDLKKFLSGSLFMLGTAGVSVIAILFISTHTYEMDLYLFYVVYIVLHVVSTWVVLYIFETIRKNNKMYEQLMRTEKLQVIGEMAASVAHEIRNPLTSIKGFLQLMQKDPELAESYQNYVRISVDEVNRADQIIADYLSVVAKPADKSITWLNSRELIDHVNEIMYSYSVLNNVTIHCKEKDSFYIKGNREQFTQVLINLVKNGIESSENKGGKVIVNSSKKGKYNVVEIIDDGTGIPEGKLKQLGMPFYSTKEKGTGLGLMFCYRVIESMDGKITVESQMNKGTTFRIEFPCRSC